MPFEGDVLGGERNWEGSAEGVEGEGRCRDALRNRFVGGGVGGVGVKGPEISMAGALVEGSSKYCAKGGGVGGMLEHELRRLFASTANCPTDSLVSFAGLLGVTGDLSAILILESRST